MIDYWSYPFSYKTWVQYRKNKRKVISINTREQDLLASIKQGDRIICFLATISRFIAVLEIEPSFKNHELPDSERNVTFGEIKTKILYSLTPDTALPIRNFYNKLSIFQNKKSINTWIDFNKNTPTFMNNKDGRIITEEIKQASQNLNKLIEEKGASYLI